MRPVERIERNMQGIMLLPAALTSQDQSRDIKDSPGRWNSPNSVANMRMMSALSLLTIFRSLLSHSTGTCEAQMGVNIYTGRSCWLKSPT